MSASAATGFTHIVLCVPVCFTSRNYWTSPNPFPVYCSACCTDTHTQPFYDPFPGLPGLAGARRNLLLDFVVQGKITETDTPANRLDATPSGLISDPSPSPPPFLRRMPFLPQPSHFILAWDRHQVSWLAYPVAWLRCTDSVTKLLESSILSENQELVSNAQCSAISPVTSTKKLHIL